MFQRKVYMYNVHILHLHSLAYYHIRFLTVSADSLARVYREHLRECASGECGAPRQQPPHRHRPVCRQTGIDATMNWNE